jgi:hypothetical protein
MMTLRFSGGLPSRQGHSPAHVMVAVIKIES